MTETGAKKALITGAAGFVGRTLSAYLAQRGWQVCGCDQVPSATDSGITPCDITEVGQVDAFVARNTSVTHVFHLAAVTFVPDSLRDPCQTFDVNVLGTIRLAEAVRRHIPAARFLFVASSEVYGFPETLPVTESHPLVPVTPYAISKTAGDNYCAYLHATHGMDTIRLRPFNHSGPGQSDRFVLSSLSHQIACIECGRQEPVLRVGNLSAARDFLHVNDVVRAYELAALYGISGKAYNICSGTAVRIQDALDQLMGLSHVPIRVESDTKRVRRVDMPEIRGAYTALAEDTGWKPEIPFTDLLSGLLDYWRQVEARNMPR